MLGYVGVALCLFIVAGIVFGVIFSDTSDSDSDPSPSPSATSTPSPTSTPAPTPTPPAGLELYLLGTGEEGIVNQGVSVSFSRDGSTLAVGGYSDDSSVGATWVFALSGDTWVQQGSKLVGTGNVGNSSQGYSVAISGDGSTLAVGARTDDGGIGATWIFTRSGETWSQQGSKLVGTGAVGAADQGESVAISEDGNTVAVGGSRDNTNIGAVWIFTRSAGVWTQQGSKLVGTGNIGNSRQGLSAALSADGNTVAVGGSRDNTDSGAVWIFTRSAGVWTQQGSKLVGTGSIGSPWLGTDVALSSDGDTLAVGGSFDDSSIGATWIFTRSGSIWTQQGSKLVGTGSSGSPSQGATVTLDSDGNTLAVGGPDDSFFTGAAWIFTRSGSTWTQQGSKIVLDTGTTQSRTLSFAGDVGYLAAGVQRGAWILVPPFPT